MPFFPLGGFTPLQSTALNDVAEANWAQRRCRSRSPGCIQRAPNIVLIPGTSSLAHLRENLAAASLELPPGVVSALDGVAARRRAGADVIGRARAFDHRAGRS